MNRALAKILKKLCPIQAGDRVRLATLDHIKAPYRGATGTVDHVSGNWAYVNLDLMKNVKFRDYIPQVSVLVKDLERIYEEVEESVYKQEVR
jgi:hypothetical protein